MQVLFPLNNIVFHRRVAQVAEIFFIDFTKHFSAYSAIFAVYKIQDYYLEVAPVPFPKIKVVLLRPPLNLPLTGGEDNFPPL